MIIDTEFDEQLPHVEETPRFFGANVSPVNPEAPHNSALHPESRKINFPNLDSSSSSNEQEEVVKAHARPLNRSFLRANTNKSTHSDISGIYDAQYWQKQAEGLVHEKKVHLQENYSLHCQLKEL